MLWTTRVWLHKFLYLTNDVMLMPEEKTPMPGEPKPPSPPPKKGLFGEKKAPTPSPEVFGLAEQINNLAARIRISEERIGDLRRRLQFVEQNMIQNHKKAVNDIKMVNDDVHDIKHTITEIQDRIITIIKELRLTARKEDINVLKRYIELWDPVKFVTAEHAEKIAREILAEKLRLLPDHGTAKHEGENI